MKKAVLAVVALLLVAACGDKAGNPTPPPGSQGPQGSRGQVTQPAQAGGPIDTAAIQAAVTALKTQHDAWQFGATTYQSGTPNYSQTVTGTQRTSPQAAVSATLTRAGSPDKRYTRIGEDIWYDTGTGTYAQTTASDSAVVSAYEPYSLDGLVQSATEQDYQYQPVGTEQVSGVTSTHYRLDDATIQGIVQNMQGVTSADWAADVWIAVSDGSLLRIAWGPKSADKAQLTAGVDYSVTSIDCVCPVDPPTVSPA